MSQENIHPFDWVALDKAVMSKSQPGFTVGLPDTVARNLYPPTPEPGPAPYNTTPLFRLLDALACVDSMGFVYVAAADLHWLYDAFTIQQAAQLQQVKHEDIERL